MQNSRGRFAPFEVAHPIGLLGPLETPTGAFSWDARAYVFVWVGPDRPGGAEAGAYLVIKADPLGAGAYRVERFFSPLHDPGAGFWQVAPWVVESRRHPELADSGRGVVLMGGGSNAQAATDRIHLAWMSLATSPPGAAPVRYFTGEGWSGNPRDALGLIQLPARYTSVSLAWIETAGLWVLLYGLAHESLAPNGPIIARFARSLIEWGPEIVIFDPAREGAWGAYMHMPGTDSIHPDVPPAQDPAKPEHAGWAYGAFLIDQFTGWDPARRTAIITYLMSTSSPYQVQLMQTEVSIRG